MAKREPPEKRTRNARRPGKSLPSSGAKAANGEPKSANGELKDYLNRTDIAIVFLDEDLTIRGYSPATTDIYNIQESSIGRPLEEITSRLTYESVLDDIREVLRTLTSKQKEVQRRDGRWYLMRILPQLTIENEPSGMVLSFLDIDEMRSAAERLTEASRELENLSKFPLENPNPVMRADRSGTVLYANAACALLDLPGTPTGHSLPARYRSAVSEAMNDGKRRTVEMESKGRYYALDFVPITSAGYVNIYGSDITLRKQAEEWTSQAARHWQNTFDAIPDLVSIHDTNYTIQKVNRAFAEAFGMKAEELTGRKCYEIFHHSSEPVSNCPHCQTLENGRPASEELFEPTRNTYFDVSTAPVFDANGEIIGSVHIARDITERKKSEQQTALQAGLLDAIKDVVVTSDTDGRVIYWGSGTVELLGWAAEEVVGHNVQDFMVPEEALARSEEIKQILTAGQGWSGEFTVKRRNGTPLPLLVHASPVLDAEGRAIGVISVGKDITELKEMDRLKDEFIGLVSHELRTPLTIIKGSLMAATSDGISARDVQDLVENAVEGANSLEAILENMLELSRHQADRLDLKKEPVSVAGVIEQVIRKLEEQGTSQRLVVALPAGLPAVEADRTRVERIVYNLVENAAKYSPAASEIKITGRREGDFIVTEISDQGNGLSAESQKALFRPFERLEPERHVSKGLGLGLVVCKRLVEAQGGWIKVDSEEGRGSTFSFGIPVSGTGQA